MPGSVSINSLLLPEDQDVPGRRGQAVLNAWRAGAEIAGKTQHLQYLLQKADLNDTLRTAEYQRKVEQMQLTAAEQLRDNNRDRDKMNWKSYVDSERLRQADERERNDQQNALKVDHDLTGFMSESYALDDNAPNFHQELRRIFAKYPAAARTTAGNQAFKSRGESFNNYVRKQQDLTNVQIDALKEDLNTHLWRYQRNDLSPLGEPRRWEDQYAIYDKNGNIVREVGPDPTTGALPEGARKTGKKFIKEANTDPYTQKDTPWHYYTATKEQVEGWVKTDKKLRDTQAKIPTQIDDAVHDIRAYPPSTTIKNLPNKTQLAIRALQPGSGATDEEQDAARKHLNKNGVPGY
jgi:hypothetical protein